MRVALIVALGLAGCGPKSPPKAAEPSVVPTPPEELMNEATRGISHPGLKAIVLAYWDGAMERYPTWATDLGDHRFDDRLMDLSLEAEQEWTTQLTGWADALDALDALDTSDQLNRDLLVGDLRANLATSACRYALWSFSARDNLLLSGNGLGETHPAETPEDAAHLVARAKLLASQVDTEIINLREGLRQGLVVNRVSAEKVLEQTKAELDKPVKSSALLAPALEQHPSWTEEERVRFRTDLEAATVTFREALRVWVEVVETEILPAARTEAEGLTGLPQGEACYRAMVAQHTTLPLDPEEIHQTGLDEITRLHREVSSLGKRALDRSDLQEIFTYLRTDPGLYFESEEEVEAKAADSLARARAAIPEYFGRLPKADCEVKRIPDYQAPYTTIAYYMPLVPGERPGTYFINTYAPETRPKHEAEVLAFHESIPGHHLQIAISTELDALPLFRRHLQATAFVEGWALYTEQLADEMGLYSGDLDRFGMYSFELWRASRLVVDTGIHHKGWSREQAIAFMVENTPLARNNIENEVDRYITTPGQALAYKTGQLEIWRLRRDAEQRLGERFDIKGFHDVVLGAGAVTLPVLGRRVEAWVTNLE